MRVGLAFLTGILLWILIFVEISVSDGVLGLSYEIVYVVHYFALILFVMLCSFIYFRKSRGDAGEGLLLGVIYLITGIILDSIITVPFFTEQSYIAYFSNPLLLIGFLELLILTVIFGLLFRRPAVRVYSPVSQQKKEFVSPEVRTLSDLKEGVTNQEKTQPYKGVTQITSLPPKTGKKASENQEKNKPVKKAKNKAGKKIKKTGKKRSRKK
jgi:hypothetical protein